MFSNYCIFKQSKCYAITPDTHHWFRINANEITDNCKIVVCNDPIVHMELLPSGDDSEVNAVNTIKRLLHLHTSVNHTKNNHPQPSYNNSTSSNNSTNNSYDNKQFTSKQYCSLT